MGGWVAGVGKTRVPGCPDGTAPVINKTGHARLPKTPGISEFFPARCSFRCVVPPRQRRGRDLRCIRGHGPKRQKSASEHGTRTSPSVSFSVSETCCWEETCDGGGTSVNLVYLSVSCFYPSIPAAAPPGPLLY